MEDTKKISVSFSSNMYEKLRTIAREEGKTYSELIMEAFNRYINFRKQNLNFEIQETLNLKSKTNFFDSVIRQSFELPEDYHFNRDELYER